MPPRYQFKRKERLKRAAIIKRMFNREGQSTAVFPLRLVWLETQLDSDSPAQFTLSVPKKAFPKAAHRNRIRRQLREVYRLNKPRLYEFINQQGCQYAFMLLFTGKKPVPFSELEEKLNLLIDKFQRKVEKET